MSDPKDWKPLPVSGYKPQSDENVALANEGKALEERYLRWLDRLAENGKLNQRYVALARTNVEQGAMWAIRAIFQPSRALLPDDPNT